MQVEQVDFITIPTRDIARSVAFYRDVLGIPESEHRGAEVETPNVTLAFWNPAEQGIEFQPNIAGFAIRVANVEAARKELEAKGVDFMGETFDSSLFDGLLQGPRRQRRDPPQALRAEGAS